MGRYWTIRNIFSKKERAIDRLLKLMKVEKEQCFKYLLVQDWDGVNCWLEKSKKTIKAVRRIIQL